MIQFSSVCKVFAAAEGDIHALDGINFAVGQGEFAVVRGPSGSGKTTLLMVAGAMLRPTSGQVVIDGQDLTAMSPGQRAAFRSRSLGFVFQMFHLVPYLGALDNVLLGRGSLDGRRRGEAGELLNRLGLAGRENHKPAALSAGERQRVAIARAMIKRPRVILADEPTGNLDPENATVVIDYLDEYRRQGGTVIVVTHGAIADVHADRLIHLEGGRIKDVRDPSATSVPADPPALPR